MPRTILALALILSTGGLAREVSTEYTLERGNLPIILVAGHGGGGSLEGATARQEANSSDSQFSIRKDMLTSELAELYKKEIESNFDDKRTPSLLKSEIHRKYCDLNRAMIHSSEHPQGQAAHRRFHEALKTEIDRLVSQHGWLLLLDIHGQSAQPIDLIVGSKQGTTVEPWIRSAFWGKDGLLSEVEEAGFSVAPTNASVSVPYNGGFIVRHYSSMGEVNALQLEHGRSLRFENRRHELFVKVFARGLARAIKQKASVRNENFR